MKARDIALIALFTALTAAVSSFKIPLPMVPITLQTLMVLLSGLMLGPVRGALSQLAYVVIGAAGLPVFAGWVGGMQALVGPSGGYLYGFIVAAFVTGLIANFFKKKAGITKMAGILIASLIGTSLILAMGAAFMVLILKVPAAVALGKGVIPFIPGDLIKVALASFIYLAVEQRGVLQAVES